MLKPDITSKVLLFAIAVFLAMIALRPYLQPVGVRADAARFDHIFIASAAFLYNGEQGLLLLDKRNGNVWFIARMNKGFKDPVFIIRVPFEKLDDMPR